MRCLRRREHGGRRRRADGVDLYHDSKSLKFVGAEGRRAPGLQAREFQPEGWVNSGKKDAVVAAFAGAKAAKAGTVLTLKFEALQECRTQVVLQGGYISGAKDAKLQSTATLLVECPASRFTDVDETSIITRASTSSSAAVT